MKFKSLDGWRGICAVLLALYHLPLSTHPFDLGFLRHSYLFVDFFFVLSGFVISYSYHDRLASPPALASFGIRRFGRLWPLHISILACFVILEISKSLALRTYGASLLPPFSGKTSPALLLANVFLLQTLWPEPTESWNGTSWSISVEFWTYFVFAFLQYRLARGRPIAMVALCAGSAAALFFLSDRNINVAANLAFFRCFYGFFLGCLIFSVAPAPPPDTRRPRGLGPSLVELGSVLAAAAFVTYAGDTRYALLSPLIFAVVILVFAGGRGAFSALLETRPVQLIGRLSYSIYLVHEIFIIGLERSAHLLERKLGIQLVTQAGQTGAASFDVLVQGNHYRLAGVVLAFLAALVAISAMTYRFIELPGTRFFNARAVAWTGLPAGRLRTRPAP